MVYKSLGGCCGPACLGVRMSTCGIICLGAKPLLRRQVAFSLVRAVFFLNARPQHHTECKLHLLLPIKLCWVEVAFWPPVQVVIARVGSRCTHQSSIPVLLNVSRLCAHHLPSLRIGLHRSSGSWGAEPACQVAIWQGEGRPAVQEPRHVHILRGTIVQY